MFLYGILSRLSTPASDRIVFGSTDLTESNDGGTLVVFRLCAAIAALPSLPPFFQSLCWFWRDSSCKTALPLRGVEVCLSSSAYDVWSVDVSCVSPLNRKLRFRHSLETLNPRLRSDCQSIIDTVNDVLGRPRRPWWELDRPGGWASEGPVAQCH